MFVTGVVLAAGGSRRLGRPKQLLPYRGATLLDATVGMARQCGFDQLLVALGGAAEQIRTRVVLHGTQTLTVPDYGHGCGNSLRHAITAVDARADGLVLLLGDQPGVRPDTVRTLLAKAGDSRLGVCRYTDRVGHPFWFRADVFDELVALHGDKAVWKLLEHSPDRAIEVAVPGTVPLDVDTWEDYQMLLATTTKGSCMELHDEFTVSAPIEKTWDVLTDIERIAPCMPGAQLTGVDGDVYSGQVTIKVGPVTAIYSGTITFTEKDPTTHHAVIHAKGRETRGSGNASATITAQLREDGERTAVTVDTDLKVTGKVAQFGSGMIQEVSAKLLGQFTASLEDEILPKPKPVLVSESSSGNDQAAPRADNPSASSRPSARGTKETASVDMLALAGDSVAKRALPAAGALAILIAIIVIIRGRGHSST